MIQLWRAVPPNLDRWFTAAIGSLLALSRVSDHRTSRTSGVHETEWKKAVCLERWRELKYGVFRDGMLPPSNVHTLYWDSLRDEKVERLVRLLRDRARLHEVRKRAYLYFDASAPSL